jgi:hypothetical protein
MSVDRSGQQDDGWQQGWPVVLSDMPWFSVETARAS